MGSSRTTRVTMTGEFKNHHRESEKLRYMIRERKSRDNEGRILMASVGYGAHKAKRISKIVYRIALFIPRFCLARNSIRENLEYGRIVSIGRHCQTNIHQEKRCSIYSGLEEQPNVHINQ